MAPKDKPTEAEKQKQERLKLKVAAYRAFAKVWNNTGGYGNNDALEEHFGQSIKKIRDQATRWRRFRLDHPDFNLPELIHRRMLEGGILPAPDSLIEQMREMELDPETLKGHRTFVVTSAQFNAELNHDVWKALNHYAKKRGDIPILVQAITYGAIRVDDEGNLIGTFPRELHGRMVFGSLPLCSSLHLNGMRLRPTLQQVITKTMYRSGAKGVSQIFAAPKLELQHAARFRSRPNEKEPPHAKKVMTSGAVTWPNYRLNKLGQQDRTGELATQEHAFAAWVIEICEDNKTFFARPLLINRAGVFYDIVPSKPGSDKRVVYRFSAEGAKRAANAASALVKGDWHTGSTCPMVRRVTYEGPNSIMAVLKPEFDVDHDSWDGYSTNHHDEHDPIRKHYRRSRAEHLIANERDRYVDDIRWRLKQAPWVKILRVKSNHDEVVERWLKEKRFLREEHNELDGMDLYVRVNREYEETGERPDPVEVMCRKLLTKAELKRYIFLKRDDDVLLPESARNPILVSLHGDAGLGGARKGSPKQLNEVSVRAIIGHFHSAAIVGSVWVVGTSTPRRLHYTKGPTNWTNTHCIIFENGQRMFIDIINGRWHGCDGFPENDGKATCR